MSRHHECRWAPPGFAGDCHGRGRSWDTPHTAGDITLKRAAAARGLHFGAAAETDLGTAPETYRRLLVSQCELVAPVLPWSVAPRPGEYHFDATAPTLAVARANRMPLTGFAPLWH